MKITIIKIIIVAACAVMFTLLLIIGCNIKQVSSFSDTSKSGSSDKSLSEVSVNKTSSGEASSFESKADSSRESETYKGIDISEYQGNIDFEAVKKSGIEAVYIRAGLGSNTIDSKFIDNYKNASNQGLYVGFYYYVTARNISEAYSEAERFASLIKDKAYTLRPVMDFEEFSGLDKDTINNIAEAFLSRLLQLTKLTPVLYSDEYSVYTLWNSSLAKYPLWIADYIVKSSNTLDTGLWKTWSGFQYSDNGKIGGISDNVDVDIFKGTLIIE